MVMWGKRWNESVCWNFNAIDPFGFSKNDRYLHREPWPNTPLHAHSLSLCSIWINVLCHTTLALALALAPLSGTNDLTFVSWYRIPEPHKYQNDNTSLDSNCNNFNLNKYSKNYLNHLFNTNEILASMLLTLHNINFYQELMSSIRLNIKNGTFDSFHDKYIDIL